MGPATDPNAVVNPRLQVYGIKGEKYTLILMYEEIKLIFFMIFVDYSKKDYVS